MYVCLNAVPIAVIGSCRSIRNQCAGQLLFVSAHLKTLQFYLYFLDCQYDNNILYPAISFNVKVNWYPDASAHNQLKITNHQMACHQHLIILSPFFKPAFAAGESGNYFTNYRRNRGIKGSIPKLLRGSGFLASNCQSDKGKDTVFDVHQPKILPLTVLFLETYKRHHCVLKITPTVYFSII